MMASGHSNFKILETYEKIGRILVHKGNPYKSTFVNSALLSILSFMGLLDSFQMAPIIRVGFLIQ